MDNPKVKLILHGSLVHSGKKGDHSDCPPFSYRNCYIKLQAAICRQLSAHWRQLSAHFWQWSWLCLAHSSAHQSQISAHKRQISFDQRLSLVIAWAHMMHICKHSWQQRGHSLCPCSSWSLQQLDSPFIKISSILSKQTSQSIAHCRQSLIHSSRFIVHLLLLFKRRKTPTYTILSSTVIFSEKTQKKTEPPSLTFSRRLSEN